jgi:hypothetical protein
LYLPEIQPNVKPMELTLFGDRGTTVPLIADGGWVYPF